MKRLIDFLKGKNTTGEMRRVLLSTLICVVVCACMLMGGTLAWYYTSVEVGGNVIEIGVPDVGVIVAPVGVDTLSLEPLEVNEQELEPKSSYQVEFSIEDGTDDLGEKRKAVYVQVSFVSDSDEIHRFCVLLNSDNNYKFTIQNLSFNLSLPETVDTEEGLEYAPDTVVMKIDASWGAPDGCEALSGSEIESVVVGVQVEVTPTPEPSESPEPSETPADEETSEPSETPLETGTPVPDDEDDTSATNTPEPTAEPTATPEATPEPEDTPVPTDTAAPVDDGAATPTDEPADDAENENSDQ